MGNNNQHTNTGNVNIGREAMADAKIKIGDMKYINTFPMYQYLKDNPRLAFTKGTPQELNKMLYDGDLTCSFASAATYLKHRDKYDILQFCIGAYQKVESVVLFSQEPVEFLHGKTIYTTPESATSTQLLKLIIQKFIGIVPNYTEDPSEKGSSVAQLLIGDEALNRFHTEQTPYTYDIAELWNLLTGHSSVFGLLLVAKDAPAQTKKYLHEAFSEAYNKHQEDLAMCYDNMGDAQKFLPKETVVNYWELLEYQLNPVMISSLLGMFAMIENNTLKHQDKPHNEPHTLTGAMNNAANAANAGNVATPPQGFENHDHDKPSPKLSLVDENGETYTI